MEQDGPERDGPEQDGPERDGPEQDGPEHDGPERDGPEQKSSGHAEHEGPELDPEEGRVIGSLVEKQLTTPQQYPLSLNALVLACNQQSNREPVVGYDESLVHAALARLKEKGLVRYVYPSHGRSVTRYRHVVDEKFALDTPALALIGVLLLRGPQTIGELRIRTERMASFDGIGSVEHELRGLSELPRPLVRRLPRQAGHKEDRWAELLTPLVGQHAPAPPAAPGPAGRTAADDLSPATDLAHTVGSLHEEVVGLRREVAELRREVAGLRRTPESGAAASGDPAP